MNAEVKTALVIGGGFSGMAAALMLSRQGVAVDLVEIDPDWRSYGAGISLHGATFRAFKVLDILDAFKAEGAMCDDVQMRAGPNDDIVATIPSPPLVEGAKGNGGMMRPALARMLADKVRASGVNVRLGTTFETLDTDGNVTFTDGTSGQYDLVIGADGLRSKTRETLWPEAPEPRYIGQAVWRAVLKTPPELNSVTMWMGPQLKAGINAVSPTESYLFLTENRPTRDRVADDEMVPALREMLQKFPSPILQKFAQELSEEHQVIYRPLDQLLVQQPWFKGRVALIGDAVHATTPHLASGALMGLEDAIVLAEELEKADDLETALQVFADRRWDRCRVLVENSGRLGEIEVEGGDQQEHRALMGASMGILAQPF